MILFNMLWPNDSILIAVQLKKKRLCFVLHTWYQVHTVLPAYLVSGAYRSTRILGIRCIPFYPHTWYQVHTVLPAYLVSGAYRSTRILGIRCIPFYPHTWYQVHTVLPAYLVSGAYRSTRILGIRCIPFYPHAMRHIVFCGCTTCSVNDVIVNFAKGSVHCSV